MKVLVTGADGQLGREVVENIGRRPNYEALACGHDTLDVTSRDEVFAAVSGTRPGAVVNCAAWTDVDGCESDPARAFVSNALAVRHLSEACRRFGGHLCQISTDYVFNGEKPTPYHEWDQPDPRSVYGASKLAGEREAGPDATIVRTSWVFGAHGSNIVKTVLRLAGGDDHLHFVDDQRGSPTHAADLAEVIARLVIDERPGLFHVTNQGETTWYDLAREILTAAGEDPERVKPVATVDLQPQRPAPRPANSVLANAALEASGLDLARPWQEAVGELVGELK